MHLVPRQLLSDRLCALGYLRSASPDTQELCQAVRSFQAAHGLEADGWTGPQTRRAMFDPLSHFCGVVERLEDSDRLCRWPQKRIAWTIAGRLPHLSDADQKDAFQEAWSSWSAVCGIEPLYTANARTAHVVMGSGGIDRSGGTLAWSELPCGRSGPFEGRQLQQKYDSQETWVIAEDPGRHEIDLVRVAAHEIGHVLGIPHLKEGALMAPSYNAAIRRPQADDIREAVRRYGPSDTQPEEPPPAEEKQAITLEVNGRRYVWEATVGNADFVMRGAE
jgi:hypothetical protein